ncbi:hypothetical protein CEXT_220011 [Caerostris extrusa]|uniref:Uncharacterized protein n=1 Tax=Caerostris extrusa TaxID=172846 RepID=A0AAV4MDE6_CAEEX|nr:hypothetical protein CEXT_220011 [Caerostris extrusa]
MHYSVPMKLRYRHKPRERSDFPIRDKKMTNQDQARHNLNLISPLLITFNAPPFRHTEAPKAMHKIANINFQNWCVSVSILTATSCDLM